MLFFRRFLARFRISCFATLLLTSASIVFISAASAQQGAPPPPASQPAQSQPPPYDKSIFQKPIPADQLTFLNRFAGAASGDVMRDRQFRKLLNSVIPNCMFHYGRDMGLSDALDLVIKGSPLPVEVRDRRYMIVSGRGGPYLGGRGFVWIDMQDGIGLSGFYFYPTNGEPTPTVAVFSRQIQGKEHSLEMSQLPLEFARDLNQWSAESRVPYLTTRYFLTGSNRRILLEHDEDYCATENRALVPPGVQCEQMMADAADIDETAAYYLNQVNYATNATAWMIGGDQIAWLQVRDNSCLGVADPLGCRIRVTRVHIHGIIYRTHR